jgi:hypothetical protein
MHILGYVNLKIYNLLSSNIFLKYLYLKPDVFWYLGKKIRVKNLR